MTATLIFLLFLVLFALCLIPWDNDDGEMP